MFVFVAFHFPSDQNIMPGDEATRSSEATYGKILLKPSVFDQSYVPMQLIGRERHLADMSKAWKVLSSDESPKPFRVLLTGKSGVGKTALSLRFARHLQVQSLLGGNKPVLTAFIDLINDRSIYSIIRDIYRQVLYLSSTRLASQRSMQAELFRYLNESNSSLLLVIEHGEALFNGPLMKNYNFETLSEELFGPIEGPGANFNLIINSRAPLLNMGNYMFSIELPSYSQADVVNILRQRCREGVKEGAYDEKILDSVASDSEGNLKKAISTAWTIFREAEKLRLDRVDLEFAEKIIGSAGVAYHNSLSSISKHEKLFLLAVAKAIKVRGDKSTSTSEAESVYKNLCAKYGEIPKRHTTVWGTMNTLASVGLISKAKSGKGMRGKTTIISLKDVQPEEIIEETERLLSKSLREAA